MKHQGINFVSSHINAIMIRIKGLNTQRLVTRGLLKHAQFQEVLTYELLSVVSAGDFT